MISWIKEMSTLRRLRRPGKSLMAWISHPYFLSVTCEIAGLIAKYLGALIFIFLLCRVAIVSCLGAFLSDLHHVLLAGRVHEQ